MSLPENQAEFANMFAKSCVEKIQSDSPPTVTSLADMFGKLSQKFLSRNSAAVTWQDEQLVTLLKKLPAPSTVTMEEDIMTFALAFSTHLVTPDQAQMLARSVFAREEVRVRSAGKKRAGGDGSGPAPKRLAQSSELDVLLEQADGELVSMKEVETWPYEMVQSQLDEHNHKVDALKQARTSAMDRIQALQQALQEALEAFQEADGALEHARDRRNDWRDLMRHYSDS